MGFPNFIFHYYFKEQFRNRNRVKVELKKFTLAKFAASCELCPLGIITFVCAVKWRLGLKRPFDC